MRILVTGGTGFLGRRIVSELGERHELRLLVRGGSSCERFPAGVEFAPGDVTDRLSLVRAMAGCDAVVHAAALVKILAPKLQFDRINVGGNQSGQQSVYIGKGSRGGRGGNIGSDNTWNMDGVTITDMAAVSVPICATNGTPVASLSITAITQRLAQPLGNADLHLDPE